MKLFFDNTFAPRAARSFAELLAHEHSVMHLQGRFPADTLDSVWLSELIKEADWVVFTHDRSIHRDKDYLIQACRKSNLVVVFLARAWSKMRLLQHHGKLLMRMEDLLDEVSSSKPGTLLLLGPNGGVKRI